jgi:hypothetical protein
VGQAGALNHTAFFVGLYFTYVFKISSISLGHLGLMVRRCFPVAKIVGSSPTGVVYLFFCIFLGSPSDHGPTFAIALVVLGLVVHVVIAIVVDCDTARGSTLTLFAVSYGDISVTIEST